MSHDPRPKDAVLPQLSWKPGVDADAARATARDGVVTLPSWHDRAVASTAWAAGTTAVRNDLAVG